MKKYIIILLLLLPSLCFGASTAATIMGKAPAAISTIAGKAISAIATVDGVTVAGGAWNYAGDGTWESSEGATNGYAHFGVITATATGNITKISFYYTHIDSTECKIVLHKISDGSVHETGTISSLTSPAWNDFTLVTPLAVSATNTVYVAHSCNNQWTISYDTGSNGGYVETGGYAGFPGAGEDNVSEYNSDGSKNKAVRIWIE